MVDDHCDLVGCAAVLRTKVDQNGRVLLPAEVRRALGLRQGSELLVTLEDGGRLVLSTPTGAWARLQALYDGPPAVVVDELLAERRAEAHREAGHGSADLLGA
jgi:AbrB family transcriptional regulator, stage V sporulation protein T